MSTYLPRSSEDALHDIDFVAKPGQTTAIIGSTGCGKTSLLHLITRFYDVTGGSVTVDGVDVRQMPQSTLRGFWVMCRKRAYCSAARLIPT